MRSAAKRLSRTPNFVSGFHETVFSGWRAIAIILQELRRETTPAKR
jgi:hypothetical protein